MGKKKKMSSKDRFVIVLFLMYQKKKQKLQKDAIDVKPFKCNRITISIIWKHALKNNCQDES